MTNPTCPHAAAGGLVPDRFDATKSGMKIFSRFYPFNPLQSLVSDERIQGNPRKSNTSERGVCSKKATRQENPNGPTGPLSRRSQTDSIPVQALLTRGSARNRPRPLEASAASAEGQGGRRGARHKVTAPRRRRAANALSPSHRSANRHEIRSHLSSAARQRL